MSSRSGVVVVRRRWWCVVAILTVSFVRKETLDRFPQGHCVSALLSEGAAFKRRRAGFPRNARNTIPKDLSVSSNSDLSEATFSNMRLAGMIPQNPFLLSGSETPRSHQQSSSPANSRVDYSTTRNFDPPGSLLEWEADFVALVAFQKRHGHLIIPAREARLFRFVKNMRQNYKYLEQHRQLEGKEQHNKKRNGGSEEFRSLAPSSFASSIFPTARSTKPAAHLQAQSLGLPSTRHSLNADRIRRLESIGFTWTPRQDTWKCKYDQLYQFWKEHGHTSLPPDADYKDLRSWMTYQRIRFRNNNTNKKKNHNHHNDDQQQQQQQQPQQESKMSPLSQDQIQLLEQIQFSWTPQDETWWKQFRQLELFHRNHGNFDIRGRENHKLRCWKNSLRRQCREYVQAVALEGTADGVHVSGLNTERLEALRRIRFCWLPTPAGTNDDDDDDGMLTKEPPDDIFLGYQ